MPLAGKDGSKTAAAQSAGRRRKQSSSDLAAEALSAGGD